MTKISFPK